MLCAAAVQLCAGDLLQHRFVRTDLCCVIFRLSKPRRACRCCCCRISLARVVLLHGDAAGHSARCLADARVAACAVTRPLGSRYPCYARCYGRRCCWRAGTSAVCTARVCPCARSDESLAVGVRPTRSRRCWQACTRACCLHCTRCWTARPGLTHCASLRRVADSVV
jgi:hypothetical protein